jgi:hypothetical protein
VDRIIEKIFEPLLENNVTRKEESSSSSDEEETYVYNYDPSKGKYIDGGKLHPRTQKEV